MTQFYAQPYDISASGFYFESAQDYADKAAKARNDHGQRVEEFEIQFIDGEEIDCALAKAWDVNQANLGTFFDAADEWEDHQKTLYIIAVGECGYVHDQVADRFNGLDIDIYETGSLKELAREFVEEGLFGDIPERLQFYIDHDAIARDLAVEYSETQIAGKRLIYRCG